MSVDILSGVEAVAATVDKERWFQVSERFVRPDRRSLPMGLFSVFTSCGI